MKIPLIAPKATPAISAMAMDKKGFTPPTVVNIAKIILQSPATLATDRSIPPRRRTRVCAKPMIMVKEAERENVDKLYAV